MDTILFFDMDGTIAEWNNDASIEEVTAPGYFINRKPMQQMLNALDSLMSVDISGLEICILSSVFTDNHSIKEKREWLNTHLANKIKRKNQFFVPYGESKYDYIKNHISLEDKRVVLVDDFTKNLKEWEGLGIKCLNGINNTHGTWDGYVVNANSTSDVIYRTILGILFTAA